MFFFCDAFTGRQSHQTKLLYLLLFWSPVHDLEQLCIPTRTYVYILRMGSRMEVQRTLSGESLQYLLRKPGLSTTRMSAPTNRHASRFDCGSCVVYQHGHEGIFGPCTNLHVKPDSRTNVDWPTPTCLTDCLPPRCSFRKVRLGSRGTVFQPRLNWTCMNCAQSGGTNMASVSFWFPLNQSQERYPKQAPTARIDKSGRAQRCQSHRSVSHSAAHRLTELELWPVAGHLRKLMFLVHMGVAQN